mmetsp:Transcript_4167/g.6075  ORF Transcript_4167/g.6075 Transcript_4167/m.6075 type:complete len:806 (-) Transcript_4167:260-2677(-)
MATIITSLRQKGNAAKNIASSTSRMRRVFFASNNASATSTASMSPLGQQCRSLFFLSTNDMNINCVRPPTRFTLTSSSNNCNINSKDNGSTTLPCCHGKEYTSTSTNIMIPPNRLAIRCKSSTANKKNHKNVDDASQARSESKLATLLEIKNVTNQAKETYKSLLSASSSPDESSLQNAHQNWIENEIQLSDAYSKAIKYTAKLRLENTAHKSRLLLDEMISRHDEISSESSLGGNNHKDNHSNSNNNGILIDDDIISEMIKKIHFSSNGRALPQLTSYTLSTAVIPPPTIKDFHNVMHSWASSKAKKKGVHAEALLWRMMELATLYPEYFDFPNSRTFALVIKCYANSTYNQSSERIEKLHNFHDRLATCSGSPPLTKDDPYLLMHSIKNIKDFTSAENKRLLNEWFARLHSHVLSSHETHSEEGTKISSTHDNNDKNEERVDLTGTYNFILRRLVQTGQIDGAYKVLGQMHELYDSNRKAEKAGLDYVATIDIKTNIYNLVLVSLRRKKDETLAIGLLNQMIESMSDSSKQSETGIPIPNDQSFAFAFGALRFMDMNAAKSIAENFLLVFEENVKNKRISPSTIVHHAYMELLIAHFGHRDDLLSMCDDVVDRISKLAKDIPEMEPDTDTWDIMLKACATNGKDGDEQNLDKKTKKAREIFEDIKTGKKGKLTDRSYQHMMKCVSFIEDEGERTEEIIDLFRRAAKGGFVSVEVLKLLKQNVSAKEFTDIVGRGRLADQWLVNVTSSSVKYTDFTNGGENKHARRKGKSTSKWAKKQRERESMIQTRKQAKNERREKKRMITG